MTVVEARKLLERCKAIIDKTHVVYTSGLHGSAYVNKDAIYPHVRITSKLCQMMASPFGFRGIQAVVGPAIGGVVLSQWVAHHLTDMSLTGNQVKAVYAEKVGDGLVIRRGYDRLVRGALVLVVEDILTTGSSVKKVVDAVRECRGGIVGVSALVNRGGVTAEGLDVPVLNSLIDVDLQSWPEEECPLCAEGVPVRTDIGHGAAFLARKREMSSDR